MKKILLALLVLLSLSCKFTSKKVNISELKTPATYTPQPFIEELDSKLYETSGLILFDGLLWTVNDSGGENVIYGFDFNGKIKREVEIEDAENKDWESLTEDKKHIYIGDFGNNRGNRKNLSIYKINKNGVSTKPQQKLNSKNLNFEFVDQKEFSVNLQTPYDCEAMVAYNDALLLFTKNRAALSTSVYKIPKKNGTYKLLPFEKFEIDGLITGADISPDKKTLALIGYKNKRPILWLFSEISNKNLFTDESSRHELNNIHGAQTEAICFLNNDSIIISCERNIYFKEQVFLIDLKNKN